VKKIMVLKTLHNTFLHFRIGEKSNDVTIQNSSAFLRNLLSIHNVKYLEGVVDKQTLLSKVCGE